MFIRSNLNPNYERVGDCVIRAISKVLGQSWDRTYIDLAVLGLRMKDMMSSNVVWSTYLHDKGFSRYSIPNTCPDCYTISDFAKDHPYGTYLVATGKHVVAVMDGCYFDTWNCGEEIPIYYFVKEREASRWLYSMEDTLSHILKWDTNR